MNRQFFFFLVCLFGSGCLMADVLVMKSGEQLECLVLAEDAASYRVEVRVSASIRDERLIPKDKVLDIKRAAMATEAFQEISKYVPTPDLLTLQDYERRMHEVEKFINDTSSSPHTDQAKAMLATLRQEANELLVGATKIHGRMVSAEDFSLDAFDMDARVAEIRIRRLIEAGAFVQALRAFEDFERDFAQSEVLKSLLPTMKQVVRAFASELEEMQSTLDLRLREREIGLQRMSPIPRRDAKQAINDEASQLAAINKAEKDAKANWLTVDAYSKVSIQENLVRAKKQDARLAATVGQKSADGGRIFRDALRSVRAADKNSPSVAASLEMAKLAMLPDRYIALLQAEADAKQSEDVISATVAEPNAETKPAAETKAPGGAKSAAK
jgi:hypothetical protein